MELCVDGSMLNYLLKGRKLGENHVQTLFKQIMEAIAYLHANSICHRDIKLHNILLDGHGGIKLTGF